MSFANAEYQMGREGPRGHTHMDASKRKFKCANGLKREHEREAKPKSLALQVIDALKGAGLHSPHVVRELQRLLRRDAKMTLPVTNTRLLLRQ